ncbi:aminotransferase class I/II-fold pyridoxal phosphate-dependent enzyme [Aureispira sp. CCB-E]|uniref:pyridoxal phosphate-dependent aminotransferase n=1 Tax=Aureispira sp. CCB-E TaxID=3051121 RepID=UPI002869693B|nr:aminotransferase class I/II-fold pyridoxal phosphate-dependent enzyme [Aureispira sp. CCB-E]WMX14864.1 aminotransferase class I/II-fold pyridoxal phosphate-dependent enzyme [Aureispira sp. CCB-E]
MEHTEKINEWIPKYIRKLVASKEALVETLDIKAGFLNAHRPTGLYGTVGTDEDYSQRPDIKATRLKEELAAYTNLTPQQICIGNGSTELIDLVIRTFCHVGQDHIIGFQPSNNRLKHFAKMQALEIDLLELGHNFEMPIYEVRKSTTEATKLLFIENPNHITGSCFANFDIVDLVTSFDGIVVIDESAIDYAPNQSLVSIINECSNVIIIQSFSRAWGLAGLPVGMAYASPEIIRILNILKPPFSVNTVAQKMATKALYVPDQKARIVTRTIEERAQVKTMLEKLPAVLEVFDSETNTLLIKVEDASIMTQHLRKEELIHVLNVSDLPGLDNCIRITIGKGLDNMRLVKAFKDMPIKTSGSRLFWKAVSGTLRQASSFLGIFKKILGV